MPAKERGLVIHDKNKRIDKHENKESYKGN